MTPRAMRRIIEAFAYGFLFHLTCGIFLATVVQMLGYELPF